MNCKWDPCKQVNMYCNMWFSLYTFINNVPRFNKSYTIIYLVYTMYFIKYDTVKGQRINLPQNLWVFYFAMDSNKMLFIEVGRSHTQCWKGDANFRSQFSQFLYKINAMLVRYLICYDLKMKFSQIAKTEIWNLF